LEIALTKRQAWLGREHYQVQPRFNMSPVCGVDNRKCLPPYFPVFRGQDAWFGKMVELIYPKSVCLEFPWVVKHIPSENRRWDIADTDFYLEDLFPMFFEYYLDWQKNLCSVEGPRNRMVFLANAVRDLANRSRESLVELHKDSSIGMQTKHMQKLIDVLADSQEAPDLWRKLLEEAINKASSDILQLMGEVNPEAFPGGLEFDELIDFWRAAWNDCAAAIEAWEEIRLVAPLVIRDQGLAM
jgi:hypothetical protein